MRKEKMNSVERTGYIAGIDGFRAAAVIMVFAYHLKLPFAKGGLLGVTVFFVISGYLITGILLSEIESTNTIQLKKFWIKRCKRLLPAMLAMVTVLILCGAIWNRVLFTKTCSDILSVLFGYNNWWQIFRNVSYFENAGTPSPLTHCWSLAIETQFYVLYPLLLMFLAKFDDKKKKFVCATVILAVISFSLMWILFDPAKDPSRVYYGTDTRVFSLLCGAILAFMTKTDQVKEVRVNLFYNMLGIGSFAVLLYMMAAVDGYGSFLYRGGQGVVSLLSALCILSVLNSSSILGKLLSTSFLRWIGARSYGIYLWHYPVILFISGGKKSAWWIILAEILLTGFLSAASYKFVETPVRHGVIGKSLHIIRMRPRTKRERRRQVRTLKKSIQVVSAVFLLGMAALVCIAFVPRENALNHIEGLEKQAERAGELAEQKASETDKKVPEQTLKTDQSGKADQMDKPANAQTDEDILRNLKLLLIGDSIALGATDEFYEVFPGSISDAAVSRYTTESFALYDSYVNEKGWNGDGVIFALGTNGLLYDSLSVLRDMVGLERPFIVLTARAPYADWEESNNREIYEFAKATPNTYLADWYKASEGHKEYFAEDETHLTPEGARAYIHCIKEAVLQAYPV